MTRYNVGDQWQLSFFYESGTYGTTSGARQWIGYVQTHDPDEDSGKNKTAVRYAGQASRNVATFLDKGEEYTGTFTYYPQDWKMLYFAMGSVLDGGSPSPYSHVISEVNSTNADPFNGGIFPSFGLEDVNVIATGSNFIRTYKGVVVDSYEIGITQGEPISCSVDYIAQSCTFSSGAKTAVTAATTEVFEWNDAKVQIPSGTTLTELKNATIRISNNMDAQNYIDNTRTIAQPIPRNREYDISMTVNANETWTKKLYDQYFLGGSKFNLFLPVIASTGSQQIDITFSGCYITNMTTPSRLSDVQELDITITPTSGTATVSDTVELYTAW